MKGIRGRPVPDARTSYTLVDVISYPWSLSHGLRAAEGKGARFAFGVLVSAWQSTPEI
ncbi:MAG: hypothetical protein IPH16_15550 [Haliscomenobacter sp.]|nr:hypothetical protein [Haliscomenobacter sp.]MBK8877298.1 hypothetical protein [Haliscomenobacter sp.]